MNTIRKVFLLVCIFYLSISETTASTRTTISMLGDVDKLYSIADYGLSENLEGFNQIDELEEQAEVMLNILELKERPCKKFQPTKNKNSATKFLYEIYEEVLGDNGQEPNKKTRYRRSAPNFVTKLDKIESESSNNIITFIGRDNNRKKEEEKSSMEVLFNMKGIPTEIYLRKAELRVFKNSFRKTKNLDIIQISAFPLVRSYENVYTSIPFVNTTLSYKGWLDIDVTEILKLWLIDRYGPFGFSFECRLFGNNHDVDLLSVDDVGLIDTSGEEELKPFMIGYFDGPEVIKVKRKSIRGERISNRRKRNDKHHFKKQMFEDFNAIKFCQRMNFSVNFKDLKWDDWIIAPEKFDAFFCGGECDFPLNAHMNATNHAVVQTLMHLKQPLVPKPCCVPTELSSISILYQLNDDSVELRNYRNMVALSCGCH